MSKIIWLVFVIIFLLFVITEWKIFIIIILVALIGILIAQIKKFINERIDKK